MKKVVILFVCLLGSLFSFAQVAGWELAGQPGDQLTNSATILAAHVSSAELVRGAGVDPVAGGGSMNSDGWTTTNSVTDAIANNDYYEFNMVIDDHFHANVTNVQIALRRSNSGPKSAQLRSSADNYNASLGTATVTTTSGLKTFTVNLDLNSTTFRLYGYDATGATGTLRIGDFTGNDLLINGSTLPIELIFFRGNTGKSGTQLIWQTATEIDNSHFSIQRSANGSDFTEIGEVKGAGTSYEPQEYTFTDERPLPGKNYYRLKQVDFDGKYSFSPVVSATFGKTRQMTLAPLPATETLNIQLENPTKDDGIWQVYDMNGRLLLSGEMLAESSEQSINIDGLPEGAYVLRLTAGQEVMVEQFRKN